MSKEDNMLITVMIRGRTVLQIKKPQDRSQVEKVRAFIAAYEYEPGILSLRNGHDVCLATGTDRHGAFMDCIDLLGPNGQVCDSDGEIDPVLTC